MREIWRGSASRVVVAFAVVALCSTVVSAQVVGGLTVQIVDETGPLPGATVTISSDTKQIAPYSAITDKNGQVVFPVLKAVSGYIVEASFPAYGKQRRDNIKIKASENQVITIKLAEQYTETVEVIAEREVVDLEKTTTSSKFSDDFISDLPVPGRFYQGVLTLAPGVQDNNGDGNVTVHGSRARDFKTMINGVSNVDPLTGQFMANINPNSIEEMEVITAGAGPEYGRAQGGFANIIQKQGGNEFEGVFDFIYRSSKLDGDGALTLPRDRLPQFDWLQPSIQFSGPIVKDKLWFRLSHEFIDREDPINTTNAIYVQSINQQITSDQITWQVSDRNKLAFKYDANPNEIDNIGVSSLRGPETALIFDREADIFAVTWSAPYSPQIYVESTMSYLDGGEEYRPTTRGIGNDCVSGLLFLEGAQCQNAETGETTGSFWFDSVDFRQRFALQSDATIYAKKKFLGMNHEVKVGLSIENESYLRNLEERAFVTFFIPDALTEGGERDPDPPGVALSRFSVPPSTTARATGTVWGLYFKDQMKPAQNVTIEIGARVDREVTNSNGIEPIDPRAEFDNFLALREQGLSIPQARVQAFTGFPNLEAFQQQLVQISGLNNSVVEGFFGPITTTGEFQRNKRRPRDINLENTNVAPFLAVSWDPWSNGKTKFAFTAGRHYNNIPLIIPTEELRPTRASVGLTATRTISGWILDSNVRGSINPAATQWVVDRGLRTPYQDELTFTFQRELWAETSLEVNYVNRKFRDQFQDIDINHIPGDFGACQGATLSNRDAITFDPDEDQYPDDPYRYDGATPTDFDDCIGKQIVITGGSEGPGDDQFGRENIIEAPDGVPDLYTLNPFWGPIYLIGNFNEADYEGITVALNRRQYRGWEMQGSYTWSMARGNGEDYRQFLGNDRSNLDDEYGFQSEDRRHVVKFVATTITPWGIRLGTNIQWQSGLPYSILDVKPSFDTTPPQAGDLGSNEPRTRWQYPTGIRNDQRNRSYWNFDVRAAKEFKLGRGMNMQIAAEIFNLLNDGTYIIYDSSGEVGLQINGQNDAIRRFGRQFQMSMKLSF